MKPNASPTTPVPRQHRRSVLPLKGETDLHASPALTESLNAMTKKKPERSATPAWCRNGVLE
jgi:hypothetical protein